MRLVGAGSLAVASISRPPVGRRRARATRGLRTARGLLVVLASLLVCVVGSAGPAQAHFAGGPQPSNFSGTITSITPSMPGVTVRVIDNGDRMELTNSTSTPVIVYGYDHRDGTTRDQYLKITKDGVWVNTKSGATYLNRTLYGTSSPPAPPEPDAAPSWSKESDSGTYRWHDHRTHWMSTADPPQVAADPAEPHTIISAWQVSMSYGSAAVMVSGRLDWTPPVSTPWWSLLGATLVLGLAVGVVRRWHPLGIVALSVLVVADVVHLATSPFPSPDEGNRLFAMAAAAVPTLAVIGLSLLAVRSMRRGSSSAHFPMATAGWLAAIQGLSDMNVIWNSQLPQSGPGWLARSAVTMVIGLGAGLGISAFLIGHREAPRYGADPSLDPDDADETEPLAATKGVADDPP